MKPFAPSLRRIVFGAVAAFAGTAIGMPQAGAETLRVRAGDHDGFSRIVLDLTGPADWELGRGEDEYVLWLAREDVRFDLSGVYRMIARDRIADLAQTADGRLHVTLGCDCHAKAFATAAGSVVVDIADGPPSASSPFERPLPASPPPEEPARPAPHPERFEPRPAAGWPPPRTGFGQAAPDPRLALFWRGVAPASDPQDGDGGDAAAADDSPPTLAAPSPDMPPEPPAGGKAAGATGRADAASEPPLLSIPAVPDPRVTAAQNDLLEQLGRAAAQGLIEVDRDRLRLGGHGPGTEPVAADPHPEQVADAQPGMHSETGIDRDSKLTVTRAPVTASGGTCMEGDVLDIGAWGDERPAPHQIAERRAALVGEFDRPSEDDVLALARLYLFLGFGAEARAVLAAFGVPDTPTAPLRDIGLILDGYEPDGSGALPGMTDCDTPAAMWAVLAGEGLPPGTDIAEGAVLRAFSALPPHLRHHLGPGLASRLLSAGATASARAIRDAVARLPGDGGAALGMIDGRLQLARGDVSGAEAMLAPIAAGNDPLATEALILSVEARLERGDTVDPAMAEAAAALAYERQDGPDGPVLARLHVLARAASGDFPAAFDAFHRWPGTPPEAIRHDTAARLFAMLADTADDAVFLTTYFAERALLTPLTDGALRISLAGRLSGAGFGREVRSLLTGDAGRSEAGRILLARAALTDFEPQQALMQVAGLEGPEVLDIRARAFAMGGDHLAAASSLTALGRPEPAALAAWRGGDWAGAAESAPDAIRQAIRDFDLVAQDAAPAAASPGAEGAEPDLTGELAQGRALLAESGAVRSALDALLSVTGEGSR